jgi:hypothetical protein
MHNENFENEHEMRSFVCAPCLLLRYNLEICTEKKKEEIELDKVCKSVTFVNVQSY